MKNPVYIGADHRGFKFKQELKAFLSRKNITVVDKGNLVYDKSDDYPDFAFAVGEAVAKNPQSFGVLICGSSEGVCIAANKVRGVRAVSVFDAEMAKLTRQHNDANVLCLSAWNLSLTQMKNFVTEFLKTKSSKQQRHQRRVKKISDYENKK